MGTDGLWNYVKHHGLCSQAHSNGDVASIMASDHLLIEMNALVHCTIPETKFTSKKTIEDVVTSVKRFIRLFPPSQTLSLVFDGVAPAAKLQKQKERRATMPFLNSVSFPPCPTSERRYNYDYIGDEISLVREEVVSGSEFLLACEDVLRELVEKESIGRWCRRGKRLDGLTTIISGCEEAGEGELKIASIIQKIWTQQEKEGTYTGNDVIVIIGNDSDLVLVSIASTPYREFYITHPVSLSITGISKLFEHWIKSVTDKDVRSELLPSYRIDFVFFMLLAGGDWYKGIGKDVTILWRHYTELRVNKGFFRRPLISGEKFNVDVELLRAVMNFKAPQYRRQTQSKPNRLNTRMVSPLSSRSAKDGVELLKGAVWALKSIVCGRCFDYDFHVISKSPTIAILKAATYVKGIADLIRPESSAPLPLFSPLEQCLAVLGKRGRFSAEILSALTTLNADGGEKLTRSRSASYLVSEVKRLMAHVDRTRLTPAELHLLKTYHRMICEESDTQQSDVTFMTFKYRPLKVA